jgi:GNAT superfamily N-acetyltransferase
MHDGLALPGLVAMHEGDHAGVLLHHVEGDELEVVFIASTIRGVGAGAALLESALDLARAGGCARAWVITTNDNQAALRFYQRQGWTLIAVHRDAVTEARELKPEIPVRGRDGITICDELELERRL